MTNEARTYLSDKDRYKGFNHFLWLNTFAPRTREHFSKEDRLRFEFFKRAVSPKINNHKKIEILKDNRLFRLLNNLPKHSKEKLFHVKQKRKARLDMATSKKELIAQSNLLEGKATEKDLEVLGNLKFQEKYGVFDLNELRNLAIKEDLVGFSDNLKNLADIVASAEKPADRISAIKLINDMMGFSASAKSAPTKAPSMQMELSSISTEDLEAQIKLLDSE